MIVDLFAFALKYLHWLCWM